jgi:hypothetical protein
VPAQVIPRPQPFGDPLAVLFEVDAFFGRVRRESRSVQDDELDVLGKFTLTCPREVTVADTSVNQNETLHG